MNTDGNSSFFLVHLMPPSLTAKNFKHRKRCCSDVTGKKERSLPGDRLRFLDIQVLHQVGVFFNKAAARLDLVPHQHTKHLICFLSINKLNSLNKPIFRIHRCLPQLIRIHFPETFIALHLNPVTPPALKQLLQLFIPVEVVLFSSFFHLV